MKEGKGEWQCLEGLTIDKEANHLQGIHRLIHRHHVYQGKSDSA